MSVDHVPPSPAPAHHSVGQSAIAGKEGRRVMVISNSAWNLANFRKPVIAGLVREGFEVVAVAPADGSEGRLTAMGARFVPIAMRAGSIAPLSDLGLTIALARMAAKLRPAAMLTFTVKPNIYGGLAARISNCPFYPTISGIGSAMMTPGLLHQAVTLLFRRAFKSARTIFFQNDDDCRLFIDRGLVREKQVKIVAGSGIDLAHFAPAPLPDSEPFTFLMIGRLLRDKGLAELAEASRLLRQEGFNPRVIVLGALGADNPTAVPKAQIARWVQDGFFKHLPPVDDVRPVIADCHCVVLPSYREGLPRSLLEGAAMARPLIATDVPGCRELVEHGSNGLLCELKSASALADAMRAMITMSAADRLAMGRRSRALAEARFDQAGVVDAYIEALAR